MDATTFRSRYGTTPQELQARLVIRAWKDDGFKNRLLAEPKAAIREECGIDLPSDFDVRVVEVTQTYLPVVIPEPSEDVKKGTVDDVIVLLTAGLSEQPPEVQETARRQARLLALAWKDQEFRADLLGSPRRVVERELGVQIPDGVKVEAFAESESSGYLVLPPNPNIETDELTDEQLESVAGGLTPTTVFLVSWITVTLIAGGVGVVTATVDLNGW